MVIRPCVGKRAIGIEVQGNKGRGKPSRRRFDNERADLKMSRDEV